MDAFSVSIMRGLTLKCNIKYALIIALFFGSFQSLMPVLGWFSGIHLKYRFNNSSVDCFFTAPWNWIKNTY